MWNLPEEISPRNSDGKHKNKQEINILGGKKASETKKDKNKQEIKSILGKKSVRNQEKQNKSNADRESIS
ncbi:hypothetical protein Hamer_G017588 [Homarus americanus]|uniref:Uncharacterized protein n=1 Tax=Homarus americanus TaxID=6706 RepID=A0A8J5J987_HOMAM|nr:hypothetical protein Hamer_G017588 [Homarus americanus]